MLKISMAGEGFAPVFPSDGWLLARTGYSRGRNDFKSLRVIGRHMTTNEAFLPLAGNAVMLTAGKEDAIGAFECRELELHTIHVVEKGEWHWVMFDEGGKALIVENSSSAPEDNSMIELTPEQTEQAYAALAKVLG